MPRTTDTHLQENPYTSKGTIEIQVSVSLPETGSCDYYFSFFLVGEGGRDKRVLVRTFSDSRILGSSSSFFFLPNDTELDVITENRAENAFIVSKKLFQSREGLFSAENGFSQFRTFISLDTGNLTFLTEDGCDIHSYFSFFLSSIKQRK